MIYEHCSMTSKQWLEKKDQEDTGYRKYSAAAMKSSERSLRNFTELYMAKVNYLNNVKWIKTKSKKDNASNEVDFRQVLSHEQIIKLVDHTQGIQRKSLLGSRL